MNQHSFLHVQLAVLRERCKQTEKNNFFLFLASPDAQEVMWVSEWVTESELADLTDVTLVSDDTFRRLGTWVTHDHLSSVIESNLTDVTLVSDDT